MKLLQTTICYELDSLTGKTIADIIQGGLGFKPVRIRSDKFLKNGGNLNERWLKKLTGIDDFRNIEIESELGQGGPNMRFAQFPAWGFQALYIDTPYNKMPDSDKIAKLTSIKGFTFAACADSDDIRWQNEAFICNYETSKRLHDNMPKVYDPIWDRDMIDIKQNPGRSSLFPGMWLQSAWRMWFGKPSFKFMPAQRLVSFPKAETIQQLDSGIIFLQLYPEASDYAKEQSRARQAAFREWTGMNVYEDQAAELLANSGKSDPPHELKSGKFPHGGEWHYTEWLDGNEMLTRRSKAIFKRESEYDQKLKRIWIGEKKHVKC